MVTKLDYLLKLPFDFILEFSYVTRFIKPNDNYFTKIDYVTRLLKQLTLEDCININNHYDDGLSCKEISHKFLYNYPNANILKIEFYNYLSLLNDDVGYFICEVPIPNSRVDMARIQNNSYAYEIKSKRDNIKRLKKQLNAMRNIFEMNYIIIEEDLDLNVDLNHIGVYKFQTNEDEINFILEKEALVNNNIDSKKQLSLFTRDNLVNLYMKYFDKVPKSSERKLLLAAVSTQVPSDIINEEFKQMLISRPQSISLKT